VTLDLPSLSIRLVYSACTLYMMLVLFRWLSPYLEFDIGYGKWRWICRITDPVISRVRNVLPSLGPMDFGPIAVVLIVWFARVVIVGGMLGAASMTR